MILTEAQRTRHQRQDSIASQRDSVTQWALKQRLQARIIADHDVSPANSERQMGSVRSRDWLKSVIRILVPSVWFEVSSADPTKVGAYILRNGLKHYIAGFDNSAFIPEYSIFKVKEQLQFDPVNGWHLSERVGKPISEKEIRNICDGDDVFTELDVVEKLSRIASDRIPGRSEQPGWQHVNVPWGEARRGWRTTLAQLVEQRLTTPTRVESLVGSSSRQDWAARMGKHRVLPSYLTG